MTAACSGCIAVPAAIETIQQGHSVQLSVPSVRCSACISAIENHLSGLIGVSGARVNLSNRRVEVNTQRPVSEMINALADIGYEAFSLDAITLGNDTDAKGHDLLMKMGVSGFAMMNVMLLSVAVWSGATGATRDLFHLISAGIALPATLYASQPFFQNALSALRVKRLNMDVPISLAIILAGGMSLFESLQGGEHAYFDAALSLTFFLLIGRYLEHHTRSTARSAAKEIAALEVNTAERLSEGCLETVATSALRVGDTILVPTGIRVPVDGSLLSDTAHTDRSFLTGESEPVSHAKNAALNAGEINLGAPFHMVAEAVGQDTRLNQIARLVETAENGRNRYTSLADRAAQIYAPAVHLLALATFLGWVFTTQDVRHALNVAVAVLIITCPCALGLAVPAVSTAAMSRLYRLGFLVKSDTALERLAEVKTIVFDKTGTLTRPGFSFDLAELSTKQKTIAKALSENSAHPLSKALSLYLGDIESAPLSGVREYKGLGVEAICKGKLVALGRADWLKSTGSGLALQIGQTQIDLPYRDVPLLGLSDMATDLRADDFALEVVSGDSQKKTRKIASMIGTSRFEHATSPEGKARYISERTRNGHVPCMVGDGINDTAALTAAFASIAPGTALDAARNAADVVMVHSHLHDLPKLFLVAKRMVRLSKQNFGIAVAYNAVAIPIAVLGYATPLMAALAMSLSSVTVLLNAMRAGIIR